VQVTNQFRVLDRKVFLSNSLITEHARGVKWNPNRKSQSNLDLSKFPRPIDLTASFISQKIDQFTGEATNSTTRREESRYRADDSLESQQHIVINN
jgi:hypothetical protein